MLEGRRLAILGAGKLGETLLRGLLEAKATDPSSVVVTAGHEARIQQLAGQFGVKTADSNATAVVDADLVILAVKPQKISQVIGEIAPALKPSQLVISVAAGVSLAPMEAAIPGPVPVIRAMPNTPCRLNEGMTGLAPGTHVQADHIALARAIFEAVGRVVVVDEKHMDAVTGLSASGPAFIYIIIESLAEAGVKVGLPRDVATELAAQTVRGAAAMVLETGEHPAKLKDAVTTPAGCTMDGILELEDGGLRVTLIKAVVKATQRATELVDDSAGTTVARDP